MSVLVGKKAPDFNVKAIINGGEIKASFKLSDLKGKYVLLFFYPFDFTFVCPTELHAFQEKLTEFENRNVQVIGCSVDSEFSHLSWLQTPRKEGGIQGINYPLASDINKTIARDYEKQNSRAFTEGRPDTLKGHDLCFQCSGQLEAWHPLISEWLEKLRPPVDGIKKRLKMSRIKSRASKMESRSIGP